MAPLAEDPKRYFAPGRHDSGFSFRLIDPLDEEMLRLRYSVYTAVGYLSPDDCPTGLDIDEYDAHSIHFGAYDSDGVLSGVIRLIRSNPLGYPIEKAFDVVKPDFGDVDDRQFVEVSRLVTKELNGSRRMVMLGLIRCAFRYSLDHDCPLWYLAADSRVYNLLAKYGFAFTLIGEARQYLGSLTIPAFIDIRAGAEYLKVFNPDMHSFLMET